MRNICLIFLFHCLTTLKVKANSISVVEKKNVLTSRAESLNKLGPRPKSHPILIKTSQSLGLVNQSDIVFRYHYDDAILNRQESEKPYGPFSLTSVRTESWLSIKYNLARHQQNAIRAGLGPISSPPIFYSGPAKAYGVQDTTFVPIEVEYDKLNVWQVVLDWLNDPSVKKMENQQYRDHDRLVMQRPRLTGVERLFIDPKTFFPIKLEYQEASSLWGQIDVEIVYSNWTFSHGVYFAGSSFRLEDGEVVNYRTSGRMEIDDTDPLILRANSLPLNTSKNIDREWHDVSQIPELIKVDEGFYLIKGDFYNEALMKIGDIVYVFNASNNQERAEQDLKIIRKEFPGYKEINVIVTSLGWSHIGGLRYWVSQGARIISHQSSFEFLRKIVSRQWKLKPDYFQNHQMKMDFLPINKIETLPGGLKIFPLEGIAWEGALICYLPKSNVLWAGDHIQPMALSSPYSKQMISQLATYNIKPKKVVAQHLNVIDWEFLLDLNKK